MKKTSILLSAFAATLLLFGITACKKEATGTDLDLLNKAKATAGFVWYKNTDALLPRSSGSGHSEALLRTRYNATAAASLDTAFKVSNAASFAEGSLIVKELHTNASTLSRYAVLYKQSTHPDADANGWVWGYIDADGKVAEPAANKGSACRNCHLQADNIDYMLMNKYFP